LRRVGAAHHDRTAPMVGFAHPTRGVTRILVIRLGALGDFVQSLGPFAAIRAQHPGAEITLLTTAPFAPLARLAPWFDRVEIDARPAWWNLAGVLRLRRQVRRFDFVYDLQTSQRSSRYFRVAGRPPWSGIAPGCSHPQADPARETMHTFERQRDQLRLAGINSVPPPDLHFLTARPVPDLPARFALLVPGAAPHRPAKRWPAERFAALATILAERGLTPVVIGAAADAKLAATIRAACPAALDLTGRTALADLFAFAARAALAVGNDTGPMHIAAAVGAPCVVLFSADSNPAMTAPRGPDGAWPTVLRAPVLADLSVERVAAALP
jgi:ADP-heptose:LPS heptosyltransferase